MDSQAKNNLIVAFQAPREAVVWGKDTRAKDAVTEVVALIQAGSIVTLEDAVAWYNRLLVSVFA